MKIEVFYVRDCPNHKPAVRLVQEVLRANRLSEEIEEIEIESAAEAMRLRFPGSPTIRIDGLDIDPTVSCSDHYGILCRTYEAGGSRSGLPSRQMIHDALQPYTPGDRR